MQRENNNYFEALSAMTGLDKLLAEHPLATWDRRSNLAQFGFALDHASPSPMLTKACSFTNALGARQTIVLASDPNDVDIIHGWLSRPNQHRVEPAAFTFHRDTARGGYYLDFQGQRIYNNFFPYNHQAQAVDLYLKKYAQQDGEPSHDVGVSATGTGKSHIIAHIQKALGGKGVVIAPQGLGSQIAKDLREVMPPPTVIQQGNALKENDPTLLKSTLADFSGILIVEETDLKRFMGTTQNPGWLCSAPRRHICIDEAHEFTMGGTPESPPPGMEILRRLAANNDILAITATPNQKLYEALGIPPNQPVFSMTMYDAMHVLPERPFRPLALEMKQVGEPVAVADFESETSREDLLKRMEPAMRREVLLGYFGRDEYVAPDRFYPEAMKSKMRADVPERFSSPKEGMKSNQAFYDAVPMAPEDVNLLPVAIVDAMKKNRIRYSEHKHIGFAIRPELLLHVTEDLQAIYDGTYDADALRDLTADVWKARAQSAVAEYIRMYGREEHDHALPKEIRELIAPSMRILMINDVNMNDADNQQKYKEAVRRIDPEMFHQAMPELFQEIIGRPEDIDLVREAQDAAENETKSDIRRKQGVKILGISEKEARRLDLGGTLARRIAESGKNLSAEVTDIASAADALPRYYAVTTLKQQDGTVKAYFAKDGALQDLPPLRVTDRDGTERTLSPAETVTYLVRAGRVMHVLDNYELTTGFSDADMMMTTRIVEHIGDHLVRATQILGRPIRAKDRVAALNELVSPLINLQGILGVDRHFSCFDVVAENYLERSRSFLENWQEKGRELWHASNFHSRADAQRVDGHSPDRNVGG